MKLWCSTLLLLCAANQIYGEDNNNNNNNNTNMDKWAQYAGYTFVPSGMFLSFKSNCLSDCVRRCGDNCSAVSFSADFQTCFVSYCGFVALQEDESSDTVVKAAAVKPGKMLPTPTHLFAMTDRCGGYSYGQFYDSEVNYANAVYQYDAGVLFGKSIKFPGLANGQQVNARNNPDPSFARYASKDASLTVVLRAYFENPVTEACLFELRSINNYAIVYYAYPDKIHYNFVGLRYNYLAKTISPGQWYNFAFVFNSKTGLLSIYINDVLLAEEVIPYANRYAPDYFTIGGRDASTIGHFAGSATCLGVYDKALTPWQLKEHWRSCTDGYVMIPEKKLSCCEQQCAAAQN